MKPWSTTTPQSTTWVVIRIWSKRRGGWHVSYQDLKHTQILHSSLDSIAWAAIINATSFPHFIYCIFLLKKIITFLGNIFIVHLYSNLSLEYSNWLIDNFKFSSKNIVLLISTNILHDFSLKHIAFLFLKIYYIYIL